MTDTEQMDAEVRVIAPSFGWEPGYEARDDKAKTRLEQLGYKVTFGEHLAAQFHLGTAEVEKRVADFHATFADPNVAVIMTYSGGWSANELLPLIDWDLVAANPKPLVGYSDITVLVNAIYAKTGAVGYLGPCLGTFGFDVAWEYMLENFRAVVQHNGPVELQPSPTWSNSSNEAAQSSGGWTVLQPGEAEARLLGGNLNTFHLLQGTEYQPKFDEPYVLLLEDDDESGALTPRYFSRRVESILQLPGARENLRGVLIGRFLPASKFPLSDLAKIIDYKQLSDVPVIAEMDFGHTLPIMTMPIGRTIRISANSASAELTLL